MVEASVKSVLKDADFVAFRYSRAVSPNVMIICVCVHMCTLKYTHTHVCTSTVKAWGGLGGLGRLQIQWSCPSALPHPQPPSTQLSSCTECSSGDPVRTQELKLLENQK